MSVRTTVLEGGPWEGTKPGRPAGVPSALTRPAGYSPRGCAAC